MLECDSAALKTQVQEERESKSGSEKDAVLAVEEERGASIPWGE